MLSLHQSVWAPQVSWQITEALLHMCRIETRAGHGAGKPTEMVISEVSDCFAFAAEVVGANFQL